MQTKPFHTSFKIDDLSFGDVKALLKWVKSISLSSYNFLIDWFDNDDFIEVQTSGSTGKPKLIRLKKQFMINSALATGAYFEIKENARALVCLSADYIAGKMMLVRALTLGWNIDIVDPVSNPLAKTNTVYDFSAMVPMQLQNSLQNISSVKKLIVGGGVVSNTLIDKIQEINTQVFATYGMTETVTHIAVKKLNHNVGDSENQFYQALPNVKVAVDDRSCLVIEAPNVSDETVVTNDVVSLVSDTQFEWLGRYDNVINSGGVKLHPEKIEKQLSKIITNRFFVAGISDQVLGEKLVLVVEGEERKIDFSIVELTKYQTPKKVFFVNTFIETETKKIQRKKTLDLLGLTS